MSITRGHNLQLKLLIDKKTQKVLFAEVSKDVIDFLLSLLSLPIGSLTKLMSEESTFGPLCNTYSSWEKLGYSFRSSSRMTANCVIPVIQPTSSFTLLRSSASAATKQKVDKCYCHAYYVTNNVHVRGSFCKSCQFDIYMEFLYVGHGVTKEEVKRDGYVKDGVTYAVMDDLSLMPMTPLATIAFLNKMGLDLSLLEEKTVSLDVPFECFELLKISFRSKNVLTDMFLAKEKECHTEEAK